MVWKDHKGCLVTIPLPLPRVPREHLFKLLRAPNPETPSRIGPHCGRMGTPAPFSALSLLHPSAVHAHPHLSLNPAVCLFSG